MVKSNKNQSVNQSGCCGNQSGAAYVNEGAGGCVFRPHIACDLGGKKYKHTVGKIFDDHHFQSEQKYFEFVKNTIDPEGEFTVPMFGTCVVKPHKFKKSDEKHKCSKVASEYHQIVFQDGGADFRDYLIETTMSVDEIVRHMRPLFYGIYKMSKMNYVHFDIKLENILFDEKRKKFYIIDFGLMRGVDRVYTESFAKKANFDYLWWPPEIKFWHLLMNDNITTFDDARDMFDRNFGLVRLKDIWRHFPEQEIHLKSFYMMCESNPKKAIDVIKKHASKVDVYGLGMSLYVMLRVSVEGGLYENAQLVKELFALSAKMICFDPRERISSRDALLQFDTIMRKHF